MMVSWFWGARGQHCQWHDPLENRLHQSFQCFRIGIIWWLFKIGVPSKSSHIICSSGPTIFGGDPNDLGNHDVRDKDDRYTTILNRFPILRNPHMGCWPTISLHWSTITPRSMLASASLIKCQRKVGLKLNQLFLGLLCFFFKRTV